MGLGWGALIITRAVQLKFALIKTFYTFLITFPKFSPNNIFRILKIKLKISYSHGK